jgi:hypothetical protein
MLPAQPPYDVNYRDMGVEFTSLLSCIHRVNRPVEWQRDFEGSTNTELTVYCNLTPVQLYTFFDIASPKPLPGIVPALVAR